MYQNAVVKFTNSYEVAMLHNSAMKKSIVHLCIFLLQSTLRFVIPYLVKKASPSSSAILRHIAKELKMNRREMLLENFKFIFSFLVRSCSPSELEKALGYVQVKSNLLSFFVEDKGGGSRQDMGIGVRGLDVHILKGVE